MLVVGGNDEQDQMAAHQYHRLASELGIEQIVELRSNVPQDQLALYYSAATVCAIPSAYESFGMVALESMACQTPVVAFDVGGIATTVQDGCTGFLARRGDRTDFARKLTEALESDSLASMGRRRVPPFVHTNGHESAAAPCRSIGKCWPNTTIVLWSWPEPDSPSQLGRRCPADARSRWIGPQAVRSMLGASCLHVTRLTDVRERLGFLEDLHGSEKHRFVFILWLCSPCPSYVQ